MCKGRNPALGLSDRAFSCWGLSGSGANRFPLSRLAAYVNHVTCSLSYELTPICGVFVMPLFSLFVSCLLATLSSLASSIKMTDRPFCWHEDFVEIGLKIGNHPVQQADQAVSVALVFSQKVSDPSVLVAAFPYINRVGHTTVMLMDMPTMHHEFKESRVAYIEASHQVNVGDIFHGSDCGTMDIMECPFKRRPADRLHRYSIANL